MNKDYIFTGGKYEQPHYWKPIKEFDGMYDVSHLGFVSSWRGMGQSELSGERRFLKPVRKGKEGNLRVFLTSEDEGKVKTRYVHRIVAKYFVPNPENKSIVIHLDFDNKNNRYDNLKWVDRNELSEHMIKFDKMSKGEKHSGSKLTKKQVLEIKKKYKAIRGVNNKSQSEIAKEYNISRATIGLILNNKIWKHI